MIASLKFIGKQSGTEIMNDTLKKFMLWTASIGAALTAVFYLLAIIILVTGIQNTLTQEKQLLFSLMGAVTGMIMMYLLREQGISLAANESESKQIMSEYYKALNKTKKLKQLKMIGYYRVLWLVIDLFTKGVTVMASTMGIIYVFIEGNGDLGLILLATANLFLFTTFGIIGLSKAYDKYINEHLPAVIERTQQLKDQVGSVPLERDKNETKQCEVSEPTTASGGESKEHPQVIDRIQSSIHNATSDTRSVIAFDSKLN